MTAPAPESSKQGGGKKSFRGAHDKRQTPRRWRRGVRGVEGRDADGTDGMGNGDGYPPPQPTRGSEGAAVSYIVKVVYQRNGAR